MPIPNSKQPEKIWIWQPGKTGLYKGVKMPNWLISLILLSPRIALTILLLSLSYMLVKNRK